MPTDFDYQCIAQKFIVSFFYINVQRQLLFGAGSGSGCCDGDGGIH